MTESNRPPKRARVGAEDAADALSLELDLDDRADQTETQKGETNGESIPSSPPPDEPEPAQSETADALVQLQPKYPRLSLPEAAPFCPSVFGSRPIDGLLRAVATWLYTHLPLVAQFADPERTQIEIEAKLGCLMDNSTEERLSLPVGNEVIVRNRPLERGRSWFAFESNMTAVQHQQFNQLLNGRVQQSKAPEFPGQRLEYEHTREIDYSYEVTSGGRVAHRIRVSYDPETGRPLPNRCIVKAKVAELNVHHPSAPLDYRLTINTETETALPGPDVPVSSRRHKDRLSYQHELVRVDLTQVVQDATVCLNPAHPKAGKVGLSPEALRDGPKRHELEVELTGVDALLREKARLGRAEPNRFLEIVDVFLGNTRALAQRAAAFKGAGATVQLVPVSGMRVSAAPHATATAMGSNSGHARGEGSLAYHGVSGV